MTTLLAIESQFLARPEIKNVLKLNEVKQLQRTIGNAKKKRFEDSLKLGSLMTQAKNWFTSEEGKTALQNAGISWNVETFYLKVFGFQKSFANKLIKAANHPAEVLEQFLAHCEEKESEGNDSPLSIEAFNKFAKGETVETEGEETEGEEGQPRQSDRTKYQFTYLNANGDKVTVKAKETGKIGLPEGEDLAQIIAQLDAFRYQLLNG